MSNQTSLDEQARTIALRLLEGARAEPAVRRAVVAPPPPKVTGRGIDVRRASMFVAWFDRLLTVHRATANALADETASTASVGEQPTRGELETGLIAIHRMLMAHPVATKASYRALLAEGRNEARTAEGAALRERLASSAEVRRASMLWRTLSMDMFDANDAGELPSAYLDHLLRVVDASNPASILGALFTADES